MLSIEEQVEIKVLARQGMSIREISRQLQVSRNTVRHYLRDITATQRTPRKRRRHKLDPYRGISKSGYVRRIRLGCRRRCCVERSNYWAMKGECRACVSSSGACVSFVLKRH